MTEIELRVAAVLSGLIFLSGLSIAAWAIQTHAKRSFLAQGMFLLMLGLALSFMFILPEGILRTSLSGALVLGTMGWVLAGFTFLHRERREQDLRRTPADQ